MWRTSLVAWITLLPCWPAAGANVGVFLGFETAPPDAVVKSMQQEAEGLLTALGWQLDWRALSQNRGDETFSRIVLVQFSGTCDPFWAGNFGRSDAPLGISAVSEGRVIPFSTIDCSAIRDFVFAAELGNLRDRGLMGRALGRVLAHELFHVLLRTGRHHEHGVAAASQTARQLIQERRSFEAEEWRQGPAPSDADLPPLHTAP